MNKCKHIKYVHERKYFAEIEVELLETDSGWSPYLSIEDALKIDDVRDALQHNDVEKAKINASVYEVVSIN